MLNFLKYLKILADSYDVNDWTRKLLDEDENDAVNILRKIDEKFSTCKDIESLKDCYVELLRIYHEEKKGKSDANQKYIMDHAKNIQLKAIEALEVLKSSLETSKISKT